jgi:hypothetical protein
MRYTTQCYKIHNIHIDIRWDTKHSYDMRYTKHCSEMRYTTNSYEMRYTTHRYEMPWQVGRCMSCISSTYLSWDLPHTVDKLSKNYPPVMTFATRNRWTVETLPTCRDICHTQSMNCRNTGERSVSECRSSPCPIRWANLWPKLSHSFSIRTSKPLMVL